MPSILAALSKASPRASSIVCANSLYVPIFSIRIISQCFPEATSAVAGNSIRLGLASCDSVRALAKGERACPSTWLTEISGTFNLLTSSLAFFIPTPSAIANPGPAVTATASISAMRHPACRSARSIIQSIRSSCALCATEGTTPPNSACSEAWDHITLDRTVVPSVTAAAVSSHDVSTARIFINFPSQLFSRFPSFRTRSSPIPLPPPHYICELSRLLYRPTQPPAPICHESFPQSPRHPLCEHRLTGSQFSLQSKYYRPLTGMTFVALPQFLADVLGVFFASAHHFIPVLQFNFSQP